MLNKEQTSRITRIIALIAAISFVLSFIPILYTGFSNRNTANKQSPTNSATTTTTATTSTNSRAATTESAPKNNADKVKNLLDQAGLNVEIKNYELAVTYYKQALEADPKSLEAKSGLGVAQVLNNDTEAGYNQLKEVLAADSGQAESQFYLGEAAAKLKKPDEAKSAYEAYLKIEPTGKHADAAKKAL